MHSRTMPTAGQVMQRDVFTLTPDMDVVDAVRSLLGRGISGAPVVDGEFVVGMFSERDSLTVLGASAYEEEPSGTVSQHMRHDVVCASESTDVFALAQLFYHHPIRRIPVVDERRRLVGIVTRSEVLRRLLHLHLDHTVRSEPKTPYERIQLHLS